MPQPSARVMIGRAVRAWPVLAALMMSTAFAHAGPAPQVVANGETLVGAFDAELPQVAGFKGVPFAAPPVGDLRWREPRPL